MLTTFLQAVVRFFRGGFTFGEFGAKSRGVVNDHHRFVSPSPLILIESSYCLSSRVMVADYEKRITRDSGPAKIINFHVFSKSASCSTTARRKKGCRRESICCPPEIQGKYAEWLLFRPCCALISHQALLSNIIRQAFGEYHNRVVTSEAQLLVIRIMFEPGRRTLLNGR